MEEMEVSKKWKSKNKPQLGVILSEECGQTTVWMYIRDLTRKNISKMLYPLEFSFNCEGKIKYPHKHNHENAPQRTLNVTALVGLTRGLNSGDC